MLVDDAAIPQILALDFDGVICDGLIIFKPLGAPTVKSKPSLPTPPADSASFYQLRPVIETGWEMPVLIRALVLGHNREDEAGLGWDFSPVVERSRADGSRHRHETRPARDEWITTDLAIKSPPVLSWCGRATAIAPLPAQSNR